MTAVMKILFGPPGTGKTFQAAREAVAAVAPEEFGSLNDSDPDYATKLNSLHEKLLREGRILWVTFHPSYSYQDFVEGYRPVKNQYDDLSYEVVDGPFKTLCRLSTRDIEVGEVLESGSSTKYEVIGKDMGGWLLKCKVSRSDAVSEVSIRYADRYSIERAIAEGLPPAVFSIAGKTIYDLSKYNLLPLQGSEPAPDTGKGETATRRTGATIRKIAAGRMGFTSSYLSNCGHLAAVYSRLNAVTSPSADKRTALVIDEINRADLSKVFGELITLLEKDKRQGETEERMIQLPYSRAPFTVPRGLSVIGTMNTMDKSVSHMDFAMRRRFDFEYVGPDSSLCASPYAGVNLGSIFKLINDRIALLLSPDYCVGHSMFMANGLSRVQKEQNWTGADNELRSLAFVFKYKLIPLVSAYFKGDIPKVLAICASSRFNNSEYKLFERTEADPAFITSMELYDYDLSEAETWQLTDWLDPCGPTWDAARFEAFIKGLEQEAEQK